MKSVENAPPHANVACAHNDGKGVLMITHGTSLIRRFDRAFQPYVEQFEPLDGGDPSHQGVSAQEITDP